MINAMDNFILKLTIPPQTQQLNPIIPQNNSSKSRIILIVIIIFLFVISINRIIYLLGTRKDNIPKEAKQEEVPTTTQIPISLAAALKDTITMRGSSMNPNYIDNQSYSVNKEYYKSHNPLRFDVILLIEQSANGPIEVIKRIIGLPGEKIQIIDGDVYINGNILSEPYILKKGSTKLYSVTIMKEGQTIDITQDQYFVMGDNREHSSDSRDWGFLKKENITGKLD